MWNRGKSNTQAETKKQAGGLSVENYRLTIDHTTNKVTRIKFRVAYISAESLPCVTTTSFQPAAGLDP